MNRKTKTNNSDCRCTYFIEAIIEKAMTREIRDIEYPTCAMVFNTGT